MTAITAQSGGSGVLAPLADVFEGHEIRATEQSGEVWIPVIDLSKAWGLHRNTLRELINRNEEMFRGYLAQVTYSRQNGPDSGNLNELATSVNERGLYLLMGKISVDRLKNPGTKDIILRFQRWVPELIQKFRKRELAVPIPAQLARFKTVLALAKIFAENSGTPIQVAQCEALAQLEDETGEDYSRFKRLLRVALPWQDRGGYKTVTELGEMIGESPHRINTYLSDGAFGHTIYQIRNPDGKGYIPTEAGRPYCREIPFIANNLHAGWQLLWDPEIVYVSGMRRRL
jgi:prophage antirepressor-like protein